LVCAAVVEAVNAPVDRDYIGMLRDLPWLLARYVAGFVIVLLVTLFYRHQPLANATTVGFTFLLVILAASTLWGFRVSIFMSVAAALAYDYFFLPPLGTLNITDPQDWVALSSFLITSVVGSHFAAWARHEAKEADRRRQEVERLYDFSQRLLSAENPIELLNSIPRDIVESFHVGSAALFLSDSQGVYYSGIDLSQMEDGEVRSLAASEDFQREAERNVCVLPIRLGEKEIGNVRIVRPVPSPVTLAALGTLIAVAIERVRAVHHIARIEGAREGERLKSALLDAITHDFRTPLTSIKGSVTGLLSDLEFDREQKSELLLIIDEECDRINSLVSAASEMARLDSGEVKLELASHSVGELISAALGDCKGVLRTRSIHLDAKHDELKVLVDLGSARKVLVHLIDNANLYSLPGQPITISTAEKDGFVFVSVADEGPGIEETDASRIFEKFYRGRGQRDLVQGTGMGLPIAKAIVEAHGGTIGVVSRPGHGSVFTFSLSLDAELAHGASDGPLLPATHLATASHVGSIACREQVQTPY
jgi:two-component system, OmpR family, sensor histidine kinase KdpD